jgi:hypothetical protein
MVRASAIAALLLAGACAASPPAAPSRAAHRECTIVDVRWAGGEDDYDRAATIDALTAIETIVRDEPAKGADAVAARLDALLRKPASATFVSKWAVELATRLRQLACADQLGTLSRADVEHRYVQIISDIEDERAVIVDEMRRRAP